MKIHPLEALSEIYLLEKKLSPATRKSYRIAFKKYINYLKSQNIIYAKTSDVIKFRESRRESGYSTYYIYIHICALKGLYRYLRINQKRLNLSIEYSYDIMIPIRNERIRAQITKPILTIEQAKQIIICTKKNRKSIWHYRDHAIIYLMITSGLRSIEIIYARRADYQNLDDNQILYIRNKKLTDEYVKIAPGVKNAIDDYLSKRKDDNPYLFITTKNTSPKKHLSRTFFQDMFRRVLKDCKLASTKLTPHCLRHTTAMMNLLRGGTLEQTRQLLRHENIQSTLVYANYIERMKDDSEHQIETFILKEDKYDFADEMNDLLLKKS